MVHRFISLALVSFLTGLFLFGCESPTEVPDPEIPDWDGDFDVEPPLPPESPVLTPCRDGWVEVPPEGDEGVATCDPWPDGSPAAPPALTPCPAGWREVAPDQEGDVATCDPWPATGVAACGEAEAHFPGELGCTLVGSPCPAGDWSEEIPADADVLYVRAGEPAGGDGSQAAPFGTIADAMAAVSRGTIIALSRGTYDEAVSMRAAVTIWGACVAETLLTTSTWSDSEGTVTSNTNDAVVRNVRIGGSRMGVLTYQGGIYGQIHLEDVVIAGATWAGLRADMHGTITGRNIVVRDTQPRADGQRGRGLQVETFGTAELERVVFEDNREVGVSSYGENAVVRLTDVAIRGTVPPPGFPHGWGIRCEDQALVEVSRGVVEENHNNGVLSQGTDAVLRLIDVVVRNTIVEEQWGLGAGIWGEEGGRVEAERVALLGNGATGVLLAGSTMTASDLVVADTRPLEGLESAAALGYGIRCESQCELEVDRAIVTRSRDVGVLIWGSGTRAFLRDLTVSDTAPRQGDELYGYGLHAIDGAMVQVTRALFGGNHCAGVAAADPGTSAELTDVIVRDTSTDAEAVWGIGAVVHRDAALSVVGGLFDGNQAAGLAMFGAYTTLTASDVVVRNTRSLPGGYFGRGINVQCSELEGMNAEAIIERAVIEDNQDIGAYVSFDGASLELTDTLIRNTSPDDGGNFGRGLEVSAGAALLLSRAIIEGNHEVGIHTEGQRTDALISDVVVRDTAANSAGLFGRGLQAQFGVHVDLERALFERNRELSIFAVEQATRLQMAQVVVRDTLISECEDCGQAGIGVGVYGGAQLELSRFLITGSPLCALQLAQGGTAEGVLWPEAGEADLSEGEISFNNVCGANVQAREFDVDRLTERVIYRENGRNLDMQQLPVPELGLED